MTTRAMSARPRPGHGEVSPRLLTGMAATLGCRAPNRCPRSGTGCCFKDWVQPGELGPDGHPAGAGSAPGTRPAAPHVGGRHPLPRSLHEAARRVTRTTILSGEGKAGRQRRGSSS